MAELFATDGKLAEAVSILDKGSEADPRNASIYYRKAIYLLKQGMAEEAHSIIENALNIDFGKHKELFEYMPQLKDDTNVINLIEVFRVEKKK